MTNKSNRKRHWYLLDKVKSAAEEDQRENLYYLHFQNQALSAFFLSIIPFYIIMSIIGKGMSAYFLSKNIGYQRIMEKEGWFSVIGEHDNQTRNLGRYVLAAMSPILYSMIFYKIINYKVSVSFESWYKKIINNNAAHSNIPSIVRAIHDEREKRKYWLPIFLLGSAGIILFSSYFIYLERQNNQMFRRMIEYKDKLNSEISVGQKNRLIDQFNLDTFHNPNPLFMLPGFILSMLACSWGTVNLVLSRRTIWLDFWVEKLKSIFSVSTETHTITHITSNIFEMSVIQNDVYAQFYLDILMTFIPHQLIAGYAEKISFRVTCSSNKASKAYKKFSRACKIVDLDKINTDEFLSILKSKAVNLSQARWSTRALSGGRKDPTLYFSLSFKHSDKLKVEFLCSEIKRLGGVARIDDDIFLCQYSETARDFIDQVQPAYNKGKSQQKTGSYTTTIIFRNYKKKLKIEKIKQNKQKNDSSSSKVIEPIPNINRVWLFRENRFICPGVSATNLPISTNVKPLFDNRHGVWYWLSISEKIVSDYHQGRLKEEKEKIVEFFFDSRLCFARKQDESGVKFSKKERMRGKLTASLCRVKLKKIGTRWRLYADPVMQADSSTPTLHILSTWKLKRK